MDLATAQKWLIRFADATHDGCRHSVVPREFARRSTHTANDGGYGSEGQTKPRAGASSSRARLDATQNVMLQLSMRPVSALALSFTRRFHVPFNASVDRLTV